MSDLLVVYCDKAIVLMAVLVVLVLNLLLLHLVLTVVLENLSTINMMVFKHLFYFVDFKLQ